MPKGVFVFYKMKVLSLITAAGKGERTGLAIKKLYYTLGDKPILAHTVYVFEECKEVDDIYLIVPLGDIELCRENIVEKYRFGKVKKIIEGGEKRQDSIQNGLDAIEQKYDIVVIHDGARPFVTERIVSSCISEAFRFGASVVAIPVSDTLKKSIDGEIIEGTVKRDFLWQAQTPQAFSCEIIKEAYKTIKGDDIVATDDSFLVENMGVKVKMVMGSVFNIKITYPEDIKLAEAIHRIKRT